MSFQSNAYPPLTPQEAPNAGVESSYGASRKSGRRGETEGHQDGAHADPHQPLQPPSPLVGQENQSSRAASTLQSRTDGEGGGWGASLSPRGYTAARRTAEHEALHTRAAQPLDDRREARSSDPLPANRWKRRRAEQVTYASLYKEVFMYLDAVAATQQDTITPVSSQGRAEEDTEAERERIRNSGITAMQRPFSSSSASFTATSLHSSGQASPHGRPPHQHGSGGAALAVPVARALNMSVDAAMADTLRVLRSCWEYRGSPHDAFEPVRLLSPITVHLLTSYGHHTTTSNGEYVVLRGGAEQLPWVGCLYGILQSFVCRGHIQHQGSDIGGATERADLAGISRVLLLNCHSFGWLDHIGSDEYERSHRRLYQAREALATLLEDGRYAALGCHAACPMCSATAVGGDASTSVLLGDTIVMEGGAPSLGLASSQNTFTAHYQYGRGIACCVPEPRQPASAKGGDGAAADHRRHHRNQHSAEQRARAGLCAMHQSAIGEARRRGSPRWPAQPSPASPHAEEELRIQRSSGNGGQYVSPPSPSPYPHLSSPTLDVSHFPPVCCGTCRAAGVLGQALLLGPTGPLVIHLQFEEREWLEAAAPLLGVFSSGGASLGPSARSGWAMAEATAVCPAPIVNTASLRSGPAAALAAVLYAQMQGHNTTVLSRLSSSSTAAVGPLPPPPLTCIPGGGAVSLAEFVEWLVRLLHAPPPALVVEWHSGAPAALDGGGCMTGRTYAEGGVRQGSASSPPGVAVSTSLTSVISSISPSAPPHATAMGSAATSSNPEYTFHDKAAPAPPSPAPSTEPPQQLSAPLGMSVHPRLPVVPQLLETYADVMSGRPAVAATLSAAVGPREARASGRGAAATLSSLQSALSGASQQAEGKDQVLLAWVLAARDGLRPCEATTYFDGVERPLVLAKGLEVVTEGECYVSATSVVTSLQFRPRPTNLSGGAGNHYEVSG